MKGILKSIARALLPDDAFARLRRAWRQQHSCLVPIDFGDLRRTSPIARAFGYPRGEPIDRYFIHKFLSRNSDAIRGRVLEIGNRDYTVQFGGEEVTHSVVLHALPGDPETTLVGNLETGEGVPDGVFDCFILTQTIHLVYRFEDALRNASRALKPGGILLATFPSISQLSIYDIERGWGDYWRFSSLAVQRMLGGIFTEENVRIETYGNVLAAASFLYGLSSAELTERELDEVDPEFVMLVTARAEKPLS